MKFKNLILLNIFISLTFNNIKSDKIIVNNNSSADITAWSVYPGGTGVTCPSKNDRWIARGKKNDDQLSTTACTVDAVKFHFHDPINKIIEIKNIAKVSEKYVVNLPHPSPFGGLDYTFNINKNGEIEICYDIPTYYPQTKKWGNPLIKHCVSTNNPKELNDEGFIIS